MFDRDFKRRSHKVVKQTQKIRRKQPTNCLRVLDHFVGLVLKGLNIPLYIIKCTIHILPSTIHRSTIRNCHEINSKINTHVVICTIHFIMTVTCSIIQIKVYGH